MFAVAIWVKLRTLGSLDDEGMLTDLGRKMAERYPQIVFFIKFV